jgi:peptide-methionine (S)-S-oxide reductase
MTLSVTVAFMETAVLGGGCFWCLEAVYQEMEGVESVRSGYMGGQMPNPTYDQVCSGKSGHVEVAEVVFDAKTITFHDVLHVFFTIHDPTTLNRQGNDVGPQYRSVIFYTSEEQRQIAEEVIKEQQSNWRDPIVTAVEPASTFYVAEDYHQNYYRDNSRQGYCMFVVAPKVSKFREKFAEKRRARR